ncbi:transglycosylase domain-containing protein [Glycomyces xiaoerkulensis]|uniref:transglycosylase domain-containing protein n=1 Tax=Glycomyces xiaoerkulensis TaxID=2038139 RepID=UPI000DEEA24F|nr:transglycosylase domain-containing protein [Glycomyces xiaoerkulensis]
MRGSASPGAAPNQPQGGADYGWGPQQPQPPRHGSHSGAARPGAYGRPASGSASVGRASGSASVGGGRASVGSASVGGAAGSAPVGSPRPIDLGEPEPQPVSPAGPGHGRAAGRRRAGAGPLSEDDLAERKKLKKKRRRRKIYAGLIAVAVVFVAAITVVGAWFFQEVPLPQDVRRAGESSTFYYADGSSEAGGYGETLRKLVDSPDEIPDTVAQALVSLEDRKFYDHGGVDYQGTMRALVNNVTGGDTQGASTITQQYAGMVAEIRDDISYGRKAREAVMAMKLEQEYSKDEILMFYLNLAYFGRGATGVEAAAQVYFDEPLDELDHAEAAFIVMQVKSPNGAYDPFIADDEGAAAEARWNHTMDSMVETGYLSRSEREEFEFPTPIEDFEVRGSWGGDTPLGFIVNEQDGYIFDELHDRYGIAKEQLYGGEGQEGGYSVVLTIDEEIQESLEQTGSRGEIMLETNDDGDYVDEDGEVVESPNDAAKIETDDGYWQFENDNEDATLYDYDPSMTNAMVAIDSDTGGVAGYYGGDDGFGIDKAGPESPHPPSSTFKMITAATAIQNDDSIESWWNAESPRQFDSLTDDASQSCIGGGEYPDCTLRNGNQSAGRLDITLTDAVRRSKNTPMYAISEKYDASTILDNADKMGLEQMSQTVQVFDADGEPNDVSITYRLHDDGTYTMHAATVDEAGDYVVDELGNVDKEAPIRVDDDCNPVPDDEGRLVVDEDGEPDRCTIGNKGGTDPFYHHLAFGQYPTSVRDMASMYATIANDGVYNETHFVKEVRDRDGEIVDPKRDLHSEQAIAVETARDLQWVGSEISGETQAEPFSRPYFGKTGTWEATGKDKDGNDYPSSYNAHAWYVGAIPQLSIAAWVGNITSESDPISDPNGDYRHVYGSNTAYPVWYDAMTRLLEQKQDAEGWETIEWEGPVKKGTATTSDIENEDGSIDPESKYCQENEDDPKCGADEEEDEDAECRGNGNGNNQDCDDEGEGGDDTTDPTDPGDGDGDEGDEDCGGWFDPCTEEPTDDESSGDGGGGDGGEEEPTDDETSSDDSLDPPGQQDN